MDPAAQLSLLASMVLAAVLGGFIGWEREYAQKPAGFRTHILVAAASALIVLLADVLIDNFAAARVAGVVQADPIRVLQAIVVGVSFIGAGTILKDSEEDTIKNLTTAASILFTASIGVAVALELYILAVGATLLVLLVNSGLRSVGPWAHTKEPLE